MTPSLANVLHNIADHTDTLFRFLNEEGLDPEFVRRMEEHILKEEKENSHRLNQLVNEDSDPVVSKLLDHSYFIQKMISDKSISKDLKIELLDHFMEEHQEWQVGEGAPHKPGAGFKEGSVSVGKFNQIESLEGNEPQISGWTVGPMWGQGDN